MLEKAAWVILVPIYPQSGFEVALPKIQDSRVLGILNRKTLKHIQFGRFCERVSIYLYTHTRVNPPQCGTGIRFMNSNGKERYMADCYF